MISEILADLFANDLGIFLLVMGNALSRLLLKTLNYIEIILSLCFFYQMPWHFFNPWITEVLRNLNDIQKLNIRRHLTRGNDAKSVLTFQRSSL